MVGVVVLFLPRGSTALCSQAVVPPLGSTTVSGFCYFRFFAEVGTEVPFPLAGVFCLAVVLRVRKYRRQLRRICLSLLSLELRQYRGSVQ